MPMKTFGSIVRFSGCFLLFSTLYQFILNSSGQQDFVPVVAMSTDDVVTEVIYLGGRQTLLCPTVVDDLHFLFEPNDNIGNGTFAYRMLNGSFNLTHHKVRCRNIENEAIICDQLVMVYVPGSPMRGEFQIRYSAPSLSQLLVTVVFGPPFIEYFGQLPITINSTSITLIYRSLANSDSPRFAVCDALRNGNTSRILEVATLSPNESCLPPSPPSRNELNELLLFVKGNDKMSEVVQVVMGTCPGDPNGLRSPLYRVIYEVPIPSTTPATVNDSESTTPPSQEDEVPLNTTIIIIIVVAGTLVIGIIVVVVVLAVTVCLRRRRRDQLDLTPGLNLPSGGQELAVCNGELPNGHQKVVETENQDLAPAETMDGDDKETEEELDITVSRLAFVTPDSSNRFQELENILLECHNCERAHPVAGGEGSADQLLSMSDLHLTVSNWLKEDCLVYVIWASSLENLEDDSPVKHLVRLFSLRRMLDKRDKASVMHRLVFLQLGSAGNTETRVSPNNSFWVFQKLSPVDENFDSKQCGQEVFDAVQNRLQKLTPRQKDVGEEGAAAPGAPKYLKSHRRSWKLEDFKVLLEHHHHDIVHEIRDQGQMIKKRIDVRADDVNDSVATRELAETQELGETEAEEVGTEPTNNLNIIDDKKETKV